MIEILNNQKNQIEALAKGIKVVGEEKLEKENMALSDMIARAEAKAMME